MLGWKASWSQGSPLTIYSQIPRTNHKQPQTSAMVTESQLQIWAVNAIELVREPEGLRLTLFLAPCQTPHDCLLHKNNPADHKINKANKTESPKFSCWLLLGFMKCCLWRDFRGPASPLIAVKIHDRFVHGNFFGILLSRFKTLKSPSPRHCRDLIVIRLLTIAMMT